jgi:hypothetical protein
MAKNKRRPVPKEQSKPSWSLTYLQQNLILIGLIIIILIFHLRVMVIDGLSPQGVDVVASKGQTHQIMNFKRATGEQALWNPYIFSGMPIYQLLQAKAPSVDQVINVLSSWFSTPFVFYLIGSIGVYILLIYLGMTPLISFFGAITFILMPHYASLYLTGHFAKLRAVMYLPWITLIFLYFLDKRNMLVGALLALAFGLQIRTHHYQIVFYTGLLMFAVGVYPFLKDLVEKQYKRFSKSFLILIFALGLAISMAAQPLFLANEYLPYSKRGKTTISLKQQNDESSQQDQSAGVNIDYAMQWSTHPSETLTWLIPRLYGGTSGEKYSGSSVPALRNRMIPGYWGFMPFTQSYEYMGVLTLVLAVCGLFFYRDNILVRSLAFLSAFLIILSFGKHFQFFYELFFNNFPYFNKFRAPMMSVTVTSLIFCIFSAYGLLGLKKYISNTDPAVFKKLLTILAGFAILGVLIWISSSGFSFEKAGERYDERVMEMIKQVRGEFLQQDLVRYFLILILGGGTLILTLKQKLSFTILLIGVSGVSILDLSNIQSRYDTKFIDSARLEKQNFRKTATDEYIQADPEIFRIMPPPQQVNSNRWAYYHQSVGGYTPIKMYTMEEILENNLVKTIDSSIPVNLNILRMLNVKYVIFPQQINHPNLKLVFSDRAAKLYTYVINNRLPRAFFVQNYTVITDQYDRLRALNKATFDPGMTVILEEAPQEAFKGPDSSFTNLVEFTPNKLRFEVYSDTRAILVFSENYYPPGWKILLDSQQVDKIYRANHTLQAISFPPGAHTVELRFKPDSYFTNIRIASVSVGIIYLLIIISFYLTYRVQIGAVLSRIRK